MTLGSAIASLIIARSLPSVEYGRFVFFSSVVMLASTLFGLGLTAVAITRVARDRAAGINPSQTVYSLLALRLISCTPLVALGAGYSILVGDHLYRDAAIVATLGVILDFVIGLFQGFEQTWRVAVGFVIQPLSLIGLLVLNPTSDANTAIAATEYSLAICLGLLVLGLVGTGLAHPSVHLISWETVRGSLSLSGQLHIIILLQLGFGVIAVTLLGKIGRYAEAAMLSVPLVLVRMLPGIIKPVYYSAFYPRYCELVSLHSPAAANRHTTRFIESVAVIAIAASVLLAVFPDGIIALLYSEKYLDSAPLLSLLAVLTVVIACEGVLTLAMIGSGLQGQAILVLGLRMLTLCLGIGIALTRSGANVVWAVGWAHVISALSSLVVQYAIYRRRTRFTFPVRKPAIFSVFAMCVALFCRFALPDMNVGWLQVPGLGSVQFDFRLIAGGAAVTSITAAYIIGVPRRVFGRTFIIVGLLAVTAGATETTPVSAAAAGATAVVPQCAPPVTESQAVVIECSPGFATSHDRITIYSDGAVEDATPSAVTAYVNATWVFDANGDNTANLVVKFHDDPDGLHADLYDDQDGDGAVGFALVNGIPSVLESDGAWTVRVTAQDHRWESGSKPNLNLDILVDGPVRGLFSAGFAYDITQLLKTDGDIDFSIHVRDPDGDGRPDYEWRQALVPLPEDPTVSGHNRTEITVNTEDDELPISNGVLWPFISTEVVDPNVYHQGSVIDAFAHVYVKNYNESLAPIQLAWQDSKIVQIGEFVASRGNPGNYFVYSINRISSGDVSPADFENPFAFYDLAKAADGWPDMLIRNEVVRASQVPDVKDNTMEIVEYSWDQDHNHSWDFQVSVTGRRALPDVTALSELAFETVSYQRLPLWIAENVWDAGTFVQVEAQPHWTAETIREWTVENGRKVLPFGYVLGRLDEAPESAFSTIESGFRGEVAFHLVAQPWLSFSPIDARLHLVGAERGVYNVDDTRRVEYRNLDGDDTLDLWQRFAGDQLTAQLLRVPGGLLYTEGGQVTLIRAEIPAETFRTLPPTNHDEWLALGQQLDANRRDIAADDLGAMAGQFAGERLTVTGATLRDLRADPAGYRFILDLQPGYNLGGFPLGGVTGPGSYAVTYDTTGGAFSAQPLTPAAPAVEALEIDGTPTALQSLQLTARLANGGLEDMTTVPFAITAQRPGEPPQMVAQEAVDLLGGEQPAITASWTPPGPGTWTLRAVLFLREGAPVEQQVTIDVAPAPQPSWQAVITGAWPDTLPLGYLLLLLGLALLPVAGGFLLMRRTT